MWPAFPIWLPYPIARLAARLYATRSRTSGTLLLPRYSAPRIFAHSARYSRAYRSSARRSQSGSRHSWSRTTLPVYGSVVQPIGAQRLIVPAGLNFAFENQNDLPAYLPRINFATPRSNAFFGGRGMPMPDYQMQVSHPPSAPGGRPPDENRRRRDSKVPFFYNRFLSIVNRTYGPYSEFMEFMHALNFSRGNPVAFATAMATNQAIDRYYGARAQALKRHVYSTKYWNLPVGYDALSRLWR